MSASPTSSPLSSSLSSTPTPTSNGNTSSSSPSSLLFNFFVTVLSLFGVFMISGLIWHRLVIRRQMIDEMLRINVLSERGESQKPRLWDVWALRGQGFPQWRDIQPLAVEKQEIHPPLPSDSRISLWTRAFNHLPREITYLVRPPLRSEVNGLALSNYSTTMLPLDNSDVQFSLFIAMPRRSMPLLHASKYVGLETQHEVAIGTTSVAYRDSTSQQS